MSLIGNILWIFLGGGIFIFLGYLIGSVLLCLTIIGIPFGFQCIKLSLLGLIPFGKKVSPGVSSTGCLPTVMNIFWIILGGIWIAVIHLIFAFLCAVTIIGLPFASQHIKLASLAISPFGKEILN